MLAVVTSGVVSQLSKELLSISQANASRTIPTAHGEITGSIRQIRELV
jgi:hypothetical protein